MTAASYGFEFLNSAPIRFDGGPEMEWIAWLEQQKQLVKVANQHKMIAQETLAQAQQYHQQPLTASQMATQQRQPLQTEMQFMQPEPISQEALSQATEQKLSLKQPVNSIILGTCGLFVSTILFAVLFTGHSQDKKQYQAHNKLVYQHSLKSIKTGVVNLITLPVQLILQAYNKQLQASI